MPNPKQDYRQIFPHAASGLTTQGASGWDKYRTDYENLSPGGKGFVDFVNMMFYPRYGGIASSHTGTTTPPPSAPPYPAGSKPNPNQQAWGNFFAGSSFGNPYAPFHPFYDPNNPISQQLYPNYPPGQSPILPSLNTRPEYGVNLQGPQANPLGIQSILPTAQVGQGAMLNAQAGASNPFSGMPNPREPGAVTPPTQKPATEDNRGGLAANGGADKNTNTGASAGGGAGAKSNNPNVPPNAVDSGRGDKIWTDGRGKHSDNDYIEASYRFIDDKFRDGFTDAFIQQHGTDPLSFYKRAFLNDKDAMGWDTGNEKAAQYITFRAADAAINDARFLPGAVAEWQQKHGNQEIPQEQWETWWRISQSTNGYGINGGAGVSQYGVY